MKNLILISLLVLAACTSTDRTRQTLEAAGFTKIETHGRAWFACSDDDTFATSFTAVNPQGKQVRGAVCCGWWKNCTIRF